MDILLSLIDKRRNLIGEFWPDRQDNKIESTIICTLGCPKKKFYDSGQMIGEVILKWFYLYYFRFRQLFERAMFKNQNQKYIVRMRRFF